jgi:hypothetical protein
VRVVVDGANVVGARPDGWWRDRAGAALRLAQQLRAMAEGDPELELVLVLEGAARRGVPEGDFAAAVSVVHAPHEGDDEIVRQSSGADLVVTADRALRRRVSPVPVEGPSWVWRSAVGGGRSVTPPSPPDEPDR